MQLSAKKKFGTLRHRLKPLWEHSAHNSSAISPFKMSLPECHTKHTLKTTSQEQEDNQKLPVTVARPAPFKNRMYTGYSVHTVQCTSLTVQNITHIFT